MTLQPWGQELLEPIGARLGDHFELWHWEEYYPRYVAWSAFLKPRAILEIGVRFGYTALAMLAPLSELARTYVGIDDESYVADCLEVATTLIQAHSPWARAFFHRSDTADGLGDLEGLFELVHVDGDHSREGALRDLRSAFSRLAEQGAVILDDWNDPNVRGACDDFLAETPAVLATYWTSRQGHAYLCHEKAKRLC